MINIYTDKKLAYDSRLEDHRLQVLTLNTGLNKGGLATITMPAGHPAYSNYEPYKTIVEVYRDGLLRFRGRALPPADDFYNTRTVTCEGERCFLRDAVCRPYSYQDTPANIFTAVMDIYNSQVEAVKRFRVGSITVTDPSGNISLESKEAKSVQEVVDALQELCGGYIIFTTADDGVREVSWLEDIGYRSEQAIEFGENLLDFARDGSGSRIYTAVLPYGAKDSESGIRLTVDSVNDGKDYVQDDEAVALRGFMITPVVWDDVTEPLDLLRKAQEWIAQNKNIVNSLTLTALDLSYMDKSVDSYEVGDKIPVKSKPHGVDEDFMLTERTEDLLDPQSDTITLGKMKNTLTGADVAGDNKGLSELRRVTEQITADYKANIAAIEQATDQTLLSLIQQTSDAILLMVEETYATNEELEERVSSTMTQLSDRIIFEFNSLKAIVDEGDDETRTNFEELYSYISFEGGNITLGSSENGVTLTLENDLIIFKKAGQQFGWWDGVDFHTGNIVVEVNERAQFGNFAFVPMSNGSLSFLKVGGE